MTEELASLVTIVFHYTMLSGIMIDPSICTGKPCIRGLRFPVSLLLGLLAAGENQDTILASYPYLEREDIAEVLRYAAFLAEDQTVSLRSHERA